MTADEVIITETPREGWAVATSRRDGRPGPELTPELRRAGLAREVVRLVQEARKASGLRGHRPDRADAGQADGEVAEALREHADLVAAEVLATDVRRGDPAGTPARTAVHGDPDLGLRFTRHPVGPVRRRRPVKIRYRRGSVPSRFARLVTRRYADSPGWPSDVA